MSLPSEDFPGRDFALSAAALAIGVGFAVLGGAPGERSGAGEEELEIGRYLDAGSRVELAAELSRRLRF